MEESYEHLGHSTTLPLSKYTNSSNQLEYVDPELYPEYLNDLLCLLVNIFTSRTESQSECRSFEFFALIA